MDTGTANYGIMPSNVVSLKPAEVVPNKITLNDVLHALEELRQDHIAEFGYAGSRDEAMMVELQACRAELAEARKVIEKVASEVMPAITELTNGPIGAILGMKKAKK